jgi:putative PIN family toxin of toxin-antitoxin system
MMLRVVIDAGVLVGAVILPRSVPRRAFERAVLSGMPLFSDATFDEVLDVVARPKFDRYHTLDERQLFLSKYLDFTDIIAVDCVIRACRDPNDDKYLELAVSGHATHIGTGDADLSALHPFRGIEIVSPQDFLARIPDSTRP